MAGVSRWLEILIQCKRLREIDGSFSARRLSICMWPGDYTVQVGNLLLQIAITATKFILRKCK